jgi:hypothetical protein
MRRTLAVLILLTCHLALADTLNVTVGTGPLKGTSALLVFDLIDGDASANNSVTITEFQTDGTLGPPSLTGGVSGDLSSSAILTDLDFFNELAASLTLGKQIQFTLDASQTFAGGLPDNLSVFLLDPTGQNSLLSTNLPGDALLSLDLRGSPVQVPAVVSPGFSVAAGSSTNVVPEPDFGPLLTGALSVILLFRRRIIQK